ncbi:hypothetical protein EJ05DRAFT_261475 [Pseudovirgaria hyperparasitica]|uniref:AAR2-domain-containing protein n=1 Tax=Pseudovirgaria hyperparasitica TaxID=470096 RepID=A0A6A6WJ91_9PEZI|nr:uncharacterized protein EJ05DRAFT_261475 [Pseudovirgaria hyperparasitica]KAF2761361.1 hypothetical protein EJ05DRAFT_261475 [Pseudovirgaria hyperparasitica]
MPPPQTPSSTTTTTLLLTGLPPTALTGIDLLSFTPGPNFHGIKLLPPGFHFVFASATDSFSLRHGLWFHVPGPASSSSSPPLPSPPDVLAAKWDAKTETLVPESFSDAAELDRARARVGALWESGLLAYRQTASGQGVAAQTFDDGADWRLLTSHVTSALLTRVTGAGAADDADDADSEQAWSWSLTTGSSAAQDVDEIPGLTSSEAAATAATGRELRFLPINLRQTWREGATGRERTDAAQDRTWALNELVERNCHGKDGYEVLGEMQFCFVMVLTLGNYSCLEQWKRVLGLLFTCRGAVGQRAELFVETIRTLKVQLRHSQDVDGGLFDMSEDGGALLKSLVRKFRAGLEDVDGAGKADVVDELDEFEEFLRVEFGWEVGGSFLRKGMFQLEDGEQVEAEVCGYDEDDETGEFAPLVVELTTAQRRALSMDDGVDDSPAAVLDESDSDDRDLEDMDARY